MSPLEGMTPMLGVRDLEETIRFYTETLGFEVGSDWPAEGKRTWAFLTGGKAEFMIYELPEGESPRLTGSLYFYPEDVMALWKAVKGRVTVEWEPRVFEYGMREFGIRDPNGYVLNFGEPAGRLT